MARVPLDFIRFRNGGGLGTRVYDMAQREEVVLTDEAKCLPIIESSQATSKPSLCGCNNHFLI